MDTIKLDKKQTRMIAHRGVCGLERENSAAAFLAAANRSYFGIETDVYRTADGHLVLLHDGHTGRVGDRAVDVPNATLAEVEAVHLLPIDADRGAPRRDLVVPSLEDYLSICHKYDKVAVLEIKSPFTPEGLQQVVDTVRQYHSLENTIFISFLWEYLVELRRLLPDQPLQFLTGDGHDKLEELLVLHIGLDSYFPGLDRELVDTLHAAGLPVNCWTVDTLAEAEALVEMGVDFITTDILE